MKLKLVSLAVAASVAAFSANAAVSDSWNFGVAGGFAKEYSHGLKGGTGYDLLNESFFSIDQDLDSTGWGLKLSGEYNFTDWFGLGLAYDYIKGQGVDTKLVYFDPLSSYEESDKSHLNVAEIYARFALPLSSDGSDIFFKIGPTANWASGFSDKSKFSVGGVAGVGAQLFVTDNFAFRVGYDYFYRTYKEDGIRLDNSLLYLGVNYSFGGAKPVAPVAQPQRVTEKHTLDADILFPFNGDVLSAEGRNAVSTVVNSASKYSNAQFDVYGYTDRIGSDAYNDGLSQRRADAVTAELANQGVNANVSLGKGKASPVTGDKCDNVKGRKALINCLAPDRRVEVVVSGDL